MEAIELEGNTVHALSALLQRCPLQGFPVVSSHAEALIAGYITRRALQVRFPSLPPPPSLSGPPDAARVAPTVQKIVGARGEEVGDVEAGLGEAQGEGAAINLKPWFDVAPINVDEDAPLDGAPSVCLTRFGRPGTDRVRGAPRGGGYVLCAGAAVCAGDAARQAARYHQEERPSGPHRGPEARGGVIAVRDAGRAVQGSAHQVDT
eukprot:3337801-Rhodomonas_salina.1